LYREEEDSKFDLLILMEGVELSGNSDPTLAMKGMIVSMTFYGDKGGGNSHSTDHDLRKVH
jgi:hypothetical protein